MPICIINASPHKGGITDMLAEYVSSITSMNASILYLREIAIQGCTNCGHCSQYSKKHIEYSKEICPLHTKEDMPYFTAMLKGSICIFISPIYFYNVPANAKAFIDRAQASYMLQGNLKQKTSAINRKLYPILHAGRERGENLFSGTLHTLRYFATAFGMKCEPPLLFRGLDENIEETHMQEMIHGYCLKNILV